MDTYLLDIVPVAASRPRVTRYGTYYSKSYTKYKAEIEKVVEAQRFIKLFGPLHVTLAFNMKIPKSTSKKKALALDGQGHVKKPDIDNLAKGVLDALNGVLYDDDSQIVSMSLIKVYSSEPCIVVKAEPWS